jgi:hypothetical protein
MSEAGKAARQRLAALESELETRLGQSSRGILNLSTLPLSRSLLQDVGECLQSDDHLDIRMGFLVLKGLMADRVITDLPADFRSTLITRVEQLLRHSFPAVVYDAIDRLGQLRDEYPQYRERMLELLASEDTGQRRVALRYYTTYAKDVEVEPLLPFRNDTTAEEERPLGDWEYDLRNRALALIERQLGRKFKGGVLSEPYEGGRVTWHDWRPFLEWWIRNNPSRE